MFCYFGTTVHSKSVVRRMFAPDAVTRSTWRRLSWDNKPRGRLNKEHSTLRHVAFPQAALVHLLGKRTLKGQAMGYYTPNQPFEKKRTEKHQCLGGRALAVIYTCASIHPVRLN